MKPATINHRLIALKGFFRWAKQEGLVGDNPFEVLEQVLLKEQKDTAPRWLGRKEQLALLRAVRKGENKRDLAIIQTLLNIPILFLLILLSLLMRPEPPWLAFIIGITGWMGTARLVRGEVFSIRERDYIEAARAVGATNRRIILRHVLPNVSTSRPPQRSLGWSASH